MSEAPVFGDPEVEAMRLISEAMQNQDQMAKDRILAGRSTSTAAMRCALPDTDLSATLAGIRERCDARASDGSDSVDGPRLLAAVEVVLKAVDRLDSERGDYGHLVNRHETAEAFRRAITTALTGQETGEP